MMNIGEKIKLLRKQQNISQEVLGEHLGVSYQAISKWENGITMPDVTLIPAIAFYFGVSTDELFDFNVYEVEREVEAICNEAYKHRVGNVKKAEKILRDGLRRFPGNAVILNNLLYTMDWKDRSEEVISLCKKLIETTNEDDVKYDALRILANCYHQNDKQYLVEETLNRIPEIYFSKNELMAKLTMGESSFENAMIAKINSADDLIEMLVIAGKHLIDKGEVDKGNGQIEIALKVAKAFENDMLNPEIYESLMAKLN